MPSTRQPRRSDTRQRIQDVAVELFAEQGYEKTSLREIAERLDVTKAALYYHFKTKEDIVVSLFEDLARPLDETLAWGESQERGLDTSIELLRRYSEALEQAVPMFRFLHENQAAVRDLRIGETFKERSLAMVNLLTPPGAGVEEQVRCVSALLTLHGSQTFAAALLMGTAEERGRAGLAIAVELIRAAHERSEQASAEL
jgi:AcrR family transcriptional regulator